LLRKCLYVLSIPDVRDGRTGWLADLDMSEVQAALGPRASLGHPTEPDEIVTVVVSPARPYFPWGSTWSRAVPPRIDSNLGSADVNRQRPIGEAAGSRELAS